MARMHGSDVRVYLGDRDASGDLSLISPRMAADVHSVTTFSSNGWKESDPGLVGWSVGLEGFYDPAASGYGRQLEDLLGTTRGIVSIYDDDADAIGDKGWLSSDSVLTERAEPVSVADLIRLNGTLQGSGRAGLDGRLLHVSGEETITGNSSSLDGTASSANGGRANLHILAITGTWTIKVQDSTDDSAWNDLATFSSQTATTALTSEGTGTVDRYLRAEFTEDVAGSITFVLGFARY